MPGNEQHGNYNPCIWDPPWTGKGGATPPPPPPSPLSALIFEPNNDNFQQIHFQTKGILDFIGVQKLY